MKRNRSKKRHIPEGATVLADGSWYKKIMNTETVMSVHGGVLIEKGSYITIGEIICNAE